MDQKEILRFCMERGLLIEPEVLSLLSDVGEDEESIKLILDKIRIYTQKRIITKSLFVQEKQRVTEFFLTLPKENQKKLEKLKIKLGLEIEISKEIESEAQGEEASEIKEGLSELAEGSVKVLKIVSPPEKKLEVDDFVKAFKNRLTELRNILQDHSELDNLVSINKISPGRKISIIGIVSDKRVTKNRNIMLEIEDLTGKTKVLINQNKPEIYKQAEEIALDSVLGFTGSGDREIIFVNNIVFPDAFVAERKKSPVEECVAFIGDLQYGSKLFQEEKFLNFIDFLNGKAGNPIESRKIKYLFIVGDLVSGVGVYPSQIKDLIITDIEEQFQQFAALLGKIRPDIKIIVSPGNHDGVRLMEPQPWLDEKYAWPLYNMRNVIITGNPAYLKVGVKPEKDFEGFDILTYHGFSYPYYANVIPSLIGKGMSSPDKIMAYLMKNRHLAPTHASVQYYPSERDEHVIRKVPDVFVSGHLHKCAVSYYHNVLLISVATWEEETENQKKRGIKPDLCKVPLLNLKTGIVKILDFE